MKRLLFTLSVLLNTTFCFAENPIKPVIITGKVINCNDQTPRVIKFNFNNPLITGAQSVKLNDANDFMVRQDMLYTQNMTVNYSNYFINLYVHPGDSVHLIIDASLLNKGNYAWLAISGDRGLISTQLNLCVDYLYRLPVHENNLSLPPDAMLAAMKQDYEQYMLALNKYADENKLDPVVVKWAQRDIKYLVSYTNTEYGLRKGGSAEDKQARIKIFSDPFFDIYNPDNFQSMMFPYHLAAYISFIKKTDSSLIKENRPMEVIKKTTALILKEPAGECRDYMLYQQLSSLASKTPGILDSLKDVNTWFTKAVYYEYLKKQAEIITKPVFPATPIAGMSYLTNKGTTLSLPETDVLKYLSAKYIGKVLYIDVYATWCGPCIEEFKSTPILRQDMKGKAIVFVNLCLQSGSGNWRKLIKEKGIKGENYFFTDDATKLFMGTYKLQGFPSYMLVNKQGQIVTANAPRPSERRVLNKAINKLIDEK